MKEALIYLGSGMLFGMGACFGVAISMFCISSVRKGMIEDQKEYNKKVLSALEEKVAAIYAVEAAIKEHKLKDNA